jgi:hypothetical protein
MKSLIVAIAALLSLVACGGTEPSARASPPPVCTYSIELSPWSACQESGVQSRTVVTFTESIIGCAPDPVLVQSCTYVPPACPPQAPLTCTTPDVTMCCPSALPYYCQGLNTCLSAWDGTGCGGYLPYGCF